MAPTHPYSVHPSVLYLRSWLDTLPQKTGRSLDEWLRLVAVFAQIKPTTRTRIDLGFALKGTPATGRLIDTGGFARKDRITHRIPIASLAEIDGEVRRWLKVAYEMDA
ncbi:MAG TPA: DUF5655 domain-containing protein [Thermoanaerobaculia bacterium]|jgi:hypothetical protein